MDKPSPKFYYRMTSNADHDVVSQAMLELEYEHFRESVERSKQRLLTKKSIWDKLFPFTIKIERKN